MRRGPGACTRSRDETAVARHFVAVSTNAEAVAKFGIDPRQHVRVLGLGWRSLFDGFGDRAFDHDRDRRRQFPRDARGISCDGRTFPHAPPERNLPVLLGLLAIWNCNFLDAPTVAVLPYEQYLKRFPAYLQQLTMESNGKHVTLAGDRVDYQTGPIYWGEPGTNGQHSFYQLIHQGTRLIPATSSASARRLNPLGEQHDLLIANVFAQGEALAFGKTADEVRPKAAGGRLGSASHFRRQSSQATRSLPNGLRRARSAPWSHSTSTACSCRARSGTSTRSINGASSSARHWPNAPPRRSLARGEPVLAHDSSTNALIRRYRELRR